MNHLVAGFDRPVRIAVGPTPMSAMTAPGWEHPLEDLDDEFSAPARS
jgi:hypothetical protein